MQRTDSWQQHHGLLWLTLGVGALAIASLFAILVVSARVPQVAALFPDVDFFYPSLVLHVDLSIWVWFIALMGAMWIFHSDGRLRVVASIALLLLITSSLLIVMSPLFGGQVLMSNYLPIINNGAFLLGVALMGAGLGIGALRYLVSTASMAMKGHRFSLLESSLSVTALIALVSLFLVLLAYLTHQFDSWGTIRFEWLVWGGSHTMQLAWALAAIALWMHAVSSPEQQDERWPVRLVWLFLLPAMAGIAAMLALESYPQRIAYTKIMSIGGWTLFVFALVNLLWRLRQQGRTAFSGFAELYLGVLLFAVGGIVGGLITRDNILVPAHYHGVIGAVTLTFMRMVADKAQALGIQRRDIVVWRRWEWWYGIGTLILVVSMTVAGLNDVPRKSPGSLGDSAAIATASMALMGIGGATAILGSFGFAFGYLRRFTRLLRATGLSTHRDRRWFAFVGAISLFLVLSSLIRMLPGSGVEPWIGKPTRSPSPLQSILTPPPAVTASPELDPNAHARQAKLAELDLRFKQAIAMLHTGNFDEAVAALHRVLELDPMLVAGYVNMGYALYGQENYKAAMDFFNSAIELNPDQANAYYGMAVTYAAQDDLRAAIGAMRIYLHLADKNDPYQKHGAAAMWEWESRLGELSRPLPPAGEGFEQPDTAGSKP